MNAAGFSCGLINPLRTVAAYMCKLQPFCLLCSGNYFNILGRVLKPNRKIENHPQRLEKVSFVLFIMRTFCF